MSSVVNIHPPTIVEDIVKALSEAKNTEDLFVLRVSRLENGERYLDWYTTNNSKLWSLGALTLLTHKVMENGE